MKTFVHDGKTISYDGTLDEKIRILDSMGVSYTPTSEELEEQARAQQLKDEYQDTIATLLSIENANSPTNAQVVVAVKFLAKTVRLILRFLARNIS